MSKIKSLNRFVTRYAVREVFKNGKGETESAILLTDKKTVVSDTEEFKFFAKIGGILNLQDMNTQSVKDLIQELDSFGYYLVMANFRSFKGPNTYAILCPHFKGKPLEDLISPLVGFIPRIDGRTGDVISALRISSIEEKTKNRQWTRFVNSSKSNSNGFHELHFGYNIEKDYKENVKAKYVGLYVGKDTSLVLYDIGTIDPNKAVNPEQNRTLVQEGGFVYADADILFRLCEESDDKLLSAQELYDKYKDNENSVLGTDKYKKSHMIRDDKEPKKRSIILFLKSNPLLLPYELHITDDKSKDHFLKGKRTIVLCIPSGAQFEYVDYWELIDGFRSVQTRQNKTPWMRYLQKTSDALNPYMEELINDIPIMSFPAEDKNEKTPQNEEFFRKIVKKRKEGIGSKEKGSKESLPKDEVKPSSVAKDDQKEAKPKSKESEPKVGKSLSKKSKEGESKKGSKSKSKE